MAIIDDLFSRLLGRIPVRGTITTPSGEENYPVVVSNEIMGGPFIANNITDLKEIPVERIIKGCKCTVNEHVEEGITVPTRTYLCVVVPNQKLSESGEDVSSYWVLDRPEQLDETAIESQYSPDYKGGKPPFLSAIISKEAYNDGYGSTADYESGDTSLRIWKSTYDGISDRWVRQRTGTLADWGIPVLVDEGYKEGNYADIQFQWRLTSLGKPARPASNVDGLPNNNPIGWNDTPDIPEGEDYNIYIQTNSLWKISATKGVYGDLLSEWTDPVQVSTNPNLVRYGIDPYNTDYTNALYWRPYFTPGDKYRASRPTTNDTWTVERIAGESGEYIDYVFKEFENSYEPLESDKPTTVLGYGINGWRDGVFTAQEGYTLHVSTARKFSDGTLAEDWTIPVRYDGKNTIRATIIPKNNTGHTFKNTTNDGVVTITPSSITFQSKLYEALKEVDPAAITSVSWYYGSVETGTLIPKEAIGTEPNRKPQYGGVNDTELTIFPENVTGNQEFSCRVVFKGEDYIDSIDAIDVSDGLGYQALIESNAGFLYKGAETKTFTGYMYENGNDISTSTNISYSWTLNGAEISTARTAQVADTAVDGITSLVLKVTVQGVEYLRTEALTDVSDGVSVERQYTAKENITITNTPDTPGNPDQWSTDSADAVWAIERYEGAAWNTPYRVKGEKGDPNGAFQKTVYRVRADGTTPSWLTEVPAAKTSGTLTPVDWADTPISSAPTGSEIYGSLATFMKNPNTESTDPLVDNWTISGSWSLPFKVTTFPESGTNGAAGQDGDAGYSPTLVVEEDSDRRVLKINSWDGGTAENRPKPDTAGYYLGLTGLVPSAGQAVDIRGAVGPTGPQGADGVFSASDFWETGVYRIHGSNGTPHYESWDFRFRKAYNGLVYYSVRWYRNGSGARWRNFTLALDANNMVPVQYSLSAAAPFDTLVVLAGSRYMGRDNFGAIEDINDTGADKALIQIISGSFQLTLRFSDNIGGSADGCYATGDALGV